MTFKQEDYDEKYWKGRNILELKHNTLALQISSLFGLTKESKVLDYGCGVGQYIHSLRDLNVPAVGYEPSKVARDNAYGLAKGNIGAIYSLQPYDLVLCMDVMEHLKKEEIDITLSEISSIIKPGSHALFSICFDSDPNFDLDPTHVTARPKWWWEDQLMMKGFELLEVPKWLDYGHQFIIARKKEVKQNE